MAFGPARAPWAGVPAPVAASKADWKMEDARGMKETIGIKRMDHVCWVAHRIDDVLPLLTELMGMRVAGRFENEEFGYRGVDLKVPGGTAHFEVLEPLNDDSFLVRFLRERGPGLHHVTFEVEDTERAARAMTEFGIEPYLGVQRTHSWIETYMHPRDSGGVLFQFYTEAEDHKHDDGHGHPEPR